MKRYSVYFLPCAEEDLNEIGQFIIGNGGYPADVVGFLERIRIRCLKIGDAPRGYAQREELGKGLRVAPFERSAVIVYRIHDEAVEIVNVFYGGRNYQTLYDNDSSQSDEVG